MVNYYENVGLIGLNYKIQLVSIEIVFIARGIQ
jgi:hypothetical protein